MAARKSASGASRRSQQEQQPQRFAAAGRYARRVLMICGWTLALTGGGYLAVEKAEQVLQTPVQKVSVKGEFRHVARESVAERVYAGMNDSFFRQDLEEIRESLEELPWIDTAQIVRRWPYRLEISIVEHRPIARWGDHDALNQRGEVIQFADKDSAAAELDGLPVLVAEDGMEEEIMSKYRDISARLKPEQLTVKRLACDATRNWTVTLDNDVELVLGREETDARLDRFLAVYEAELNVRWLDLSRVDLRYFNGIAVQWRDDVNVLAQQPGGAR